MDPYQRIILTNQIAIMKALMIQAKDLGNMVQADLLKDQISTSELLLKSLV